MVVIVAMLTIVAPSMVLYHPGAMMRHAAVFLGDLAFDSSEQYQCGETDGNLKHGPYERGPVVKL